MHQGPPKVKNQLCPKKSDSLPVSIFGVLGCGILMPQSLINIGPVVREIWRVLCY